MKVVNKMRFTVFILTIMMSAGCIGYAIGSSVIAEAGSPTPTIEETPEVEPTATIKFESLGVYTVTAYCGCEKCCGEWASVPVIGAGGVELVEGVHCASPLPFGTLVDIDGVGVYEVQDRTAQWVADKYDNKIIDIYFDDHQSAVEFAKQSHKVKKVINI